MIAFMVIFPFARLQKWRKGNMAKKDIDLTTVGGRIKAKRIECGLTQVEAAEKLYMAPALYSHYENNRVDLKVSVVSEIAALFGTTAGYLIDGVENEISDEEKELLKVFGALKDDAFRKAALEQMKIILSI